jgi:hypothetical protein
MQLMAGLADQTVQFAAWTTATGAPVTVTSATGGLSLWYRRGVAGLKIPLTTGTTPAVNDLATLDAAHADAGILLIAGAEHRFDLPDAAIAAGVLTVSWGGTATGITIDGGTADLIGQANASPALASVDSILTIPAALKVVNATSIAGATTQVAAAFLAQYNVANPVFTNASVNQTGDAYATAVTAVNWAAGDTGFDAIVTAIGTRMATFTYTAPDNAGVTEILSRLPDATAGADGGLLVAGSNAATTFATLTVTGLTSFSAGVVIANAAGIGLDIDGTTNGVTINATAGDGLAIAVTAGNGNAISAHGYGSGTGMHIHGGATGDGLYVTAGADGYGIVAAGYGANKHGLYCVGAGTGVGFYADDFTVAGAVAVGGATTLASLTLTSGAIPANLTQINATSIAGTAAYVATAFVSMFNIATPVFTVASVNQTGNSYATAVSILNWIEGDSGNDAILTAIGTRMATFTYTAPDNTGIGVASAAATKLVTAMELSAGAYRFTELALELAPSGTGSSPSVIADAVCDELLAGHTIAGSAAEAITIIAGRVTNGPITTVSPVTVTGGKLLLTLTQGDAYIDGRALVVTFTDVPTTVLPNTLTSATAKLCLNPRKAGGTKLTYAATITVGTGTTKTFTISITAAESALWDVGGNAYAADIEVLIGGVATAIATIGVGGSADVSAKAK